MNLGDLLKGLALDRWYKVLVAVGGVVLAVSFFVPVQGITNRELQLLAGGVFLFGLGEWKNRKKQTRIQPPNVYLGGTALKLTREVWSPDPPGLLLDVIGLALIVFGVWSIFQHPA